MTTHRFSTLSLATACILAMPGCSSTTHPESLVADGLGYELPSVLAPQTNELEEFVPVAAGPAEPAPALTAAEILFAREALANVEEGFRDFLQESIIHREDGDLGASLEALRKGLFHSPRSATIWASLGDAWAEADRPSRAVSCWERAVELDGSIPRPRLALASYAANVGEVDLSLHHARAILRRDPNSADASRLATKAYLAKDMWQEAIEQGQRSVRLSPDDMEAYNAVGYAAMQLGRNEVAVQYLGAATELEATPAFIYNNHGQALERMNRPWEALESYRQALLLDPGHQPSRWNTARVRQQLDEAEANQHAARLTGTYVAPGGEEFPEGAQDASSDVGNDNSRRDEGLDSMEGMALAGQVN